MRIRVGKETDRVEIPVVWTVMQLLLCMVMVMKLKTMASTTWSVLYELRVWFEGRGGSIQIVSGRPQLGYKLLATRQPYLGLSCFNLVPSFFLFFSRPQSLVFLPSIFSIQILYKSSLSFLLLVLFLKSFTI